MRVLFKKGDFSMADTGKMTSRKAFACIMATKGEIQQVLSVGNSNKAYVSYNTVQALAQRFMADCGNAGTSCSLATVQQDARLQAIAG